MLTVCLYSTLKLALICKDKVLIIIGINQYTVNQTKHHNKSTVKKITFYIEKQTIDYSSTQQLSS